MLDAGRSPSSRRHSLGEAQPSGDARLRPVVDDKDPTKLTTLAQVGRVILVIGALLIVSILLNLFGVDIRGFGVLDRLPGGALTIKLGAGVPCLVIGWIMFRRGGGKEAVAAQKRALRGGST